jgi:predicted MFS family arabinose efflux permease
MTSHPLTRDHAGGPAPPPRRLAALVCGLVFVAAVAQTAIVPLLPRLAEVDGLSTATRALLLAAPGLATLAVSAPAGLFADRFGARRVTLGAAALLSLAAALHAIPGFGWLLGGRLAFGLAYGVVWTTAVAWLARAGGEAGSARLGLTTTAAAAGVAAGPALGGAAGEWAGLGAPFLAAGVLAGLLTAALAATPAPDARPSTGEDGALRAVARAGRTQPGVTGGAFSLALSGAVNSVLQLLVPLQLHALGATAGTIGLAFSGAAVLYIAVSGLVVRLGPRAATLRTNAVAALLLALALAPAVSSTAAAAIVGTLVLTVAPRATVSTIAYPLATGHGARAGLGAGAVVGLLNGAWAAAMVVAPLGAGALSASAGPRAAWLATLGMGALVGGRLILRHARPGARPAVAA